MAWHPPCLGDRRGRALHGVRGGERIRQEHVGGGTGRRGRWISSPMTTRRSSGRAGASGRYPTHPASSAGSWRALRRYYPDLYERRSIGSPGMQIRYLELEAITHGAADRGLPIAALVFPRYQAGAALERQPITATEALAGCATPGRCWTGSPMSLPRPCAGSSRYPAYRLIYGDLDPRNEVGSVAAWRCNDHAARPSVRCHCARPG